MVKIHRIPLRLSNAFLVIGDKPVLVDTGSPREAGKIVKAVARHGVDPKDVALILLTHAHTDHAGSAQAMREITGAPVALHPAENEVLERGIMDPLRPVRPRHVLLKPIVVRRYDGLKADIALAEGLSLAEFGLPARVIETPGHSPGSVSVVVEQPRPNKPNDALVGDLLIGGFLGGLIQPTRPRLPYFADDVRQIERSLMRLFSQATGRLHLGHGGPVETRHARAWLMPDEQIKTNKVAAVAGCNIDAR